MPRPPASKLVILKQAVGYGRTGHGDHRPTLKVQYGLPKSYVTLHIKVGLLASVPRPPTTSEGIHSPLQRGGDGGGAVGLRAPSSNTHRITSSSTHPRASEIGYLREDGARRPSSYYDIPCLSRLVLRITASQIKVGRWPPCHVLQQQARVFTPLSNGEGMGVGLLTSVPRPPQ